jgi:hypothetical protein
LVPHRIEFETLEHFLIGHFVVAAGVLNGLLSAGDARHLVRNLADVAETDGRGGGVGDGIVTFQHRVRGIDGGKGLGLPFVIDGSGLDLLDARDERSVGRIDAVDFIGKVFPVADGRIGRE